MFPQIVKQDFFIAISKKSSLVVLGKFHVFKKCEMIFLTY